MIDFYRRVRVNNASIIVVGKATFRADVRVQGFSSLEIDPSSRPGEPPTYLMETVVGPTGALVTRPILTEPSATLAARLVVFEA